MRLRSVLVAAPLLAVIACADDPPAAPPSVTATPDARLVGADGCQATQIVVLIATSLPPRERGAAERDFIRARLLDVGGQNELAWPTYVALSEQVLEHAKAGTLRNPPGPLTANAAAVQLIELLYQCGGRPPVGDVIFDVIERGRDVAIATVAPGVPTSIVVPSKNFGIVDEEGGFFDEPAMIIIERVPDDPPFLPQEYTEHPPRYQVRVLPATAQTNFGGPIGPTSPSILIVICPRDPHPNLDDLDILRIPDGFPAEPAQRLDAEHVHGHGVTCTDPGSFPASEARAARSVGGRMASAVRRGASAAFGWLAPQPLYAVDGGIGGRTFVMSSFVAVGEPTTPTAPGEDVIVVNDMNLFDYQRMAQAGNQRFVRNLVSFTGTGPRAAATRVVVDRGRNAPCFVATSECGDASHRRFDAAITGAGLSITKYDDVRSYAEIPSDVKVVFLFTPRVAFTPADAAGLRQFAAEGGRIVLLGEHLRFYGSAGIAVQNALLQQLGTGTSSVGAQIDCSNKTLPASSLRPHQTTAGIESMVVSCLSRLVPGPTDAAILYSSTGSDVIGVAARIGAAPPVAARAGTAPAASARRGAAAVERPTVNGDGAPIGRR